jgi:hypothetical protein
MKRTGRAVAVAMALLASLTNAQALTPFQTIGDWACSGEDDRLVVARTLVYIAGHQRPQFQESFFMRCMETAATDPGHFESRRISEVAAGCIMMELTVFSESG